MKVLLSAYSCQPNRGSEPGVGWNVATELSRSHHVWVITQPENQPMIERAIAQKNQPNLHFVYYDLPYCLRWWRKELRGMRLHYYLWQLAIHPVVRKLHQQFAFDVAQHITFVKYSAPSLLCLLPIPFIWGPVGGGEDAPLPFRKQFPLRGKIFELLRNLARALAERDPLVRLTARRATVAQATTPETARRLLSLGASSVRLCSEVGLSDDDINALAQPLPPRQPPTFISLGRLVSWKGFHLGLQAFAHAGLRQAEYWIVGDGPERARLQSLASNLRILDRVRFWGALPRQDALSKLQQSIALVHPSLHDSGGWVCVEAMATGRPVICLDLGGPGTQVTHDTGIKIPAHTPGQAARDLAHAMVRFVNDPELRSRALQSGQKLVREQYRWQTRCNSYSNLYRDVVDQWQGRFGARSPAADRCIADIEMEKQALP
ncbi:MAG: glycosyltransferase family 4 protein [Planctomycetota bacterium]|nr:glycosyltransferase family 4 protein [Planctomycetota bacterium]